MNWFHEFECYISEYTLCLCIVNAFQKQEMDDAIQRLKISRKADKYFIANTCL